MSTTIQLGVGILALTFASMLIFGQEADNQTKPAVAPRANVHDFLGLGPAPDAAAAKLGEPLYKDNCASCHGANARGAQGPNLVRSPLVLHDDEGEAIGQVVKKGKPEGGMPSFSDLNDTQIYDIAEFIHLQIELAANRGTYRQTYGTVRNQVSGNAEEGKQYFHANCSSCHSVTGDLTKIGLKYPDAPLMLSRIAWPVSQNVSQGTVTLADGQKFTGELLRFDDFDVALRLETGEYKSWPRSEVQVNVPDKLAGHRELLGKYSDSDLHNLTAYLVSIK